MAKIISKSVIEEIRVSNDIVEVIGHYVPLKRAGSTFKGLCPFHKEKTPSFNVNPRMQIFRCFGCGAAGDVFSFIERYENVDFATAARMLAERGGIRLDYETDQDRAKATDKDMLYRIHEQLAMFYHRTLFESELGKAARDYLAGREIDRAVADKFLLGYAPDRWDVMERWAKKNGWSPEQLEKVGVIIRKEGREGFYDRFRNRLMFPIRNEQGRVVAFSGRVLDGSGEGAKYVNSPETMLFKKGRMLYGLDLARQRMVDERRAFLCEGQLDVIRCHTAGFTQAIAPQGTALTNIHAHLIKRFADEVVLVFDADEAGQNAALRASEVLMADGLSVKVASLPKGEDPDSLIRTRGAEAFGMLMDDALSIVGFAYEVLKTREDLNSGSGLVRVSRAILQTIQHAPSAVLREQYIREAAGLLGVSEQALTDDMRRMLRPVTRAQDDPEQRGETSAEHPREEVDLLELMFAYPEISPLIEAYVPPDILRDGDCRTIVEVWVKRPDDPEWNLMSDLSDQSAECRRLAAEKLDDPRRIVGTDITPERAAQELILRLWCRDLDRQRRACKKKLEVAKEAERHELRIESAHLTVLMQKMKRWEQALPVLQNM